MKRKFLKLFYVVLLLFAAVSGYVWLVAFSTNTAFDEESRIFFIQTGDDIASLKERLVYEGITKSGWRFDRTLKWKKFSAPKAGRYKITNGMSSNDLINLFRSGNQEPVLVPVQNVQTLQQLAGELSRILEPDSAQFGSLFTDVRLLDSLGFTQQNFSAMFIADSYSMNWNTNPRQFVSRMKREFDNFWTESRSARAKGLGLSKAEVATLASIVKGETSQMDEAPKIAQLYLNRLASGMKLQSDPTVEYAKGSQDLRLTYDDLRNVISPYNTYLFDGLPPGPISLVESFYLDAVLNPVAHTYIYMCAKPDGSGYHNFSATYTEHRQYAAQYHEYLNRAGIK